MNAGTRIRLAIVTLVMLPALFSCLPDTRRDAVGPRGPDVSFLLPANAIDMKIMRLEALLTDKRLYHRDREIAQKLLTDYRRIRKLSRGKVSDRAYHEMIRTLFSDLDMVSEIHLFENLTDNDTQLAVVNELAIRRDRILAGYTSGDDEDVIAECRELASSFGSDALTPEIGLLFAISLARQNLTAEALAMGARAIRELEGRPDRVDLRAHLIQWHLDMGDRKKALELYEKLIDDLDERQALLSTARRRIMAEEATVVRPEDEFEEIPMNDRPLDPEATEVEIILRKVALLVEENRFRDARLLLIRHRPKVDDEPEAELLEQALKTVELAEETYRENLALKKKPTERALELIEADRFDEALEILEQEDLEQSGDPEKTRRLKELAVEKRVKQERDRAARIFLTARSTNDPEKREQLLLSSYEILKKLIATYPSTSLIDKLNANLLKVKEELGKR